MAWYLMDIESEPEWGPLERVAELVATTPWPTLDPDDFMYMHRVVAEDDDHTIHLYKARDTRRYINLDEAGHAYVYAGEMPGVPIGLDTPCEYLPLPDLESAVRHVRS